MLIDCGVLKEHHDASNRMQAVGAEHRRDDRRAPRPARRHARALGSSVGLPPGAGRSSTRLSVGEVWLAWTEDPTTSSRTSCARREGSRRVDERGPAKLADAARRRRASGRRHSWSALLDFQRRAWEPRPDKTTAKAWTG